MFGRRSLHDYAENGDLSKVRSLLDKGENVNSLDGRGRTPLHQAALGNRHEIISLLIARGGNANAEDSDGQTPLHIAAHYGHVNSVRALSASCNPYATNHAGNTPYDYAKAAGKSDVARLLYALMTRTKSKVELLLDSINGGADPNWVSSGHGSS